jgi:hypothetical protein
MKTSTTHFAVLITSTFMGSIATADMTGLCFQNIREVSAVDGFGAPDFNGTVIDLWLEFDDVNDVMLNVYNFNDVNLGTTYYQSFTGGVWAPNNQGPPFETEALQIADSFISIGGDGGSQSAGNGTGIDPNFGGNNAAGPGANSGWYNSNPNAPIGAVVQTNYTSTGLGVFIGRFSLNGSEFEMCEGTGFCTWNQGLGTDGSQASFEITELICVPSPSALALLGIAGIFKPRRRSN